MTIVEPVTMSVVDHNELRQRPMPHHKSPPACVACGCKCNSWADKQRPKCRQCIEARAGSGFIAGLALAVVKAKGHVCTGDGCRTKTANAGGVCNRCLALRGRADES